MQDSPKTTSSPEEIRTNRFLFLQVFFLVLSAFTGGFNFKVWSMLDTALLIQSIGITGLLLVLEQPRARRLASWAAVTLYVFAVLDMGINVLVAGVVGWKFE